MRRRQNDPEDFDAEAMRADRPASLEIKTPFIRGRVTNGWTIILVLGFLALGALGFVTDMRRERATDLRVKEIRELTKTEHLVLAETLRILLREERIQTYILSLSDAKRKELEIEKPDELRSGRR